MGSRPVPPEPLLKEMDLEDVGPLTELVVTMKKQTEVTLAQWSRVIQSMEELLKRDNRWELLRQHAKKR